MKIEIRGEFIKLSQLLKKMKLIDSGGQSKDFIERHDIKINGVIIKTRGTKIYDGDIVWINDQVFKIVSI